MKLTNKILMKSSLIIILSLPVHSMAIDQCSMDYLGLGGLISKSQMARVNKMSRLEATVQFIRNKKVNPIMVEVDRMNIEKLIRFDSSLFEGNVYLAEKAWRPFFRKFEENFYRVKKHTELLREARLNSDRSVDDIVNHALIKFQDDLFMTDILISFTKKDMKNFDHFIQVIEKRINKSASFLGRNFIRYRLTKTHIDDIGLSNTCSVDCKKGIEKLKSLLGVSGVEEQVRFPAFRGLRSPLLEEVSLVVNSIPNAYESLIIKEALMEIKAFLRDIYTVPTVRSALAKTLTKILPSRYKQTAGTIESALTDLGAYTNHFPLIDRTLRSQKTIEVQFSRLRNQNVMFAEDEMLITFARRVDKRALDGWNELKQFAKVNDDKFYQRMLKADEEALLRGEMSNDYRKSPFRSFVYILGTMAAYPIYDIFFDLDLSEIIDLEDLAEHMEIKQNAQNPEMVELHLKTKEATDFMVDMVAPMAEAIKESKKKK
jgi:hypothetical protein